MDVAATTTTATTTAAAAAAARQFGAHKLTLLGSPAG